MTLKVDFEIEVPDHMTYEQAQEWVEFCLGFGTVGPTNPNYHTDHLDIVDCQVNIS
jgi:hypothetical protein